MTVGFKFTTIPDDGTITTVTPNLLLAYHEVKRGKQNKILFASFLLFDFAVFLLCNLLGIDGFLGGHFAKNIFIVGCVISFLFLLFGIFDNTPQAVLLYTALSTEGFEEYIQEKMAKTESILKIENLRRSYLPQKVVRSLEKTLVTMETLLELSQTMEEEEELMNAIFFLKKYSYLYGFVFEDVTKELINARK